MARPTKKGLDYFPMDISLFNDIKIRKLIKYQGGKSIAIYTYLLCNIYQNGYYIMWDKELPFVISEVTGYEEGYILEVIKCCIKIGLFSEELFNSHSVLTSKGIQNRFMLICINAKRKYIISEFNLINSEETNINSEETNINSGFSTQRKVKESKGKEIEEKTEQIPPPPNNEISSDDPHIDLVKKILLQQKWIETFRINLKIPESKNNVAIRRLLHEFLNHLVLESKVHAKEKDFKSHFTAWCRKLDRIRLEEIFLKKSSASKTSKQPNNGSTDYYFLN